MEIWITGYTRAGLMPVYDTDERDNINLLPNRQLKTGIRTGYFRPPPVIHFSGVSIGSDRGMNDGRKIRGSVQLIGGGEVRWQMVGSVVFFILAPSSLLSHPSFPLHLASRSFVHVLNANDLTFNSLGHVHTGIRVARIDNAGVVERGGSGWRDRECGWAPWDVDWRGP